MTRQGRYYRLNPSLSEDIDKRINELDKKALFLKKLINIINTVKANGLYSNSEYQKECDRLDNFQAPAGERQLIIKAWDIRKKLNLNIMKECEQLLDDIENYLKENDNK